ncbi:MAG: hypothetical protein ACE5FA_10815 [Dehalococcoidia bacterium]
MDFKLMLLSGLFSVFLVACARQLDSSLTTLETGDCVKSPGFTLNAVDSLEQIDCSEPGSMLVLRTFDIKVYEEWPGDADINRLARSGCPPRTNYVLSPTEDSWAQAEDREVICFE